MLQQRIIPCLLLHEGGLVKTEKFRNAKYVGDPINAVKIFNEKEVDELIFLDIDASRVKKSPNYKVIKDLASECFMPFAYGGGISDMDQIKRILEIGVEKIIINKASLENLKFIESCTRQFGSSTIIVAMDIQKDFFGRYKVYDHVTKRKLDLDPQDYIKEIEKTGPGEIFINNVDRDGTYKGFDIDEIKILDQTVSVPLIACGGASSLENIKQLFSQTGVSAAAAGSLFVYQGPHRAVLISYPSSLQLKEIFS